MKSGTNFADRNRIREWHEAGADAQAISRNLKIKVEVVQGTIDSLKSTKKRKPRKPDPDPIVSAGESVGDDIPPNSIEV
jgi:hypothetical protein